MTGIELKGGGSICNTTQRWKTDWRDKLRWRLFPAQHCDVPVAPPSYKDCLSCRITVTLSFSARIRLLFSGRLMVDSKTVTENTIGASVTSSVAYPMPIKLLERQWD